MRRPLKGQFQASRSGDSGPVQQLEQQLTLGRNDAQLEVAAHFGGGDDETPRGQTRIEVSRERPRLEQHLTIPGLVVLQILTSTGHVQFADGAGHQWP